MSSRRVPGSPLDVVPFGRPAPHTSGFLAAPFPAGDLGHVGAVFSSGLLSLRVSRLSGLQPFALRDGHHGALQHVQPPCRRAAVAECGTDTRWLYRHWRSAPSAGRLAEASTEVTSRRRAQGAGRRVLAVDRAQARRARTVEKPASRDVLNGRRNGLVNTGANVGFIRSPDRCVRRPPHRAAPVRHGKRIALTRPLQSHVTSTCPSAPRGRRCRASGGRPDRAHSPTTAGACVARRRVFARDVPLRTGAPRRGRRRQCAESAVFSSHRLSTPRHM